jgi:hypothetical protein
MAETVTQTKPFKQFKKGYRQIGREAPKLWRKTDSKPFADDRVADFNTAQGDAFGMLGGLAKANTDFSDKVLDTTGQIAGGDGLAAGMNKPLGVMGNIASGKNEITTDSDYNKLSNQLAHLGDNAGKYSGVGDYKNLMGEAGDKFYSEKYLDDMARGRLVDGGNPHLEDIIRQTERGVQNQVNARMAGMGAYGGSNYAKNITRELTNAEQRLRYENYEKERARQMQAVGMLDAAQAAGFGQQAQATAGLAGSRTQDFNNQLSSANARMGAIAGKTGVQGQNIQNQLGAAGQQAGVLQQGQANRLAALGLTPELQQASYGGALAQLGMGDRMQQQQQGEIDANKAFYEENRDQDWTQLAKLGQALGMGSAYNTTNQTQQANLLESIIGGLAGAGGIAGGMASFFAG